MHSHLLPGIDDGVESLEQAISVIKGFESLGYTKLITTPHIMSDFYRNTPEIIHQKLETVKNEINRQKINITLEAAAEYNLDENFMELINDRNELLTFGNKHVLFELSFTIKPLHLKEAVFRMQSNGYRPVLAHAERYLYFHQEQQDLQDLYDAGVILQLNLLSLSGFYSRPVRKMANALIKKGMISLLGSDCHNIMQFAAFREVLLSSKVDYTSDKFINNQL